MKYVMVIAMLFSLNLNAAEQCSTQESEDANQIITQVEILSDVPAHLKGATITVTLADGRTSTVPAEKFKVVPRRKEFQLASVTVTKRSSTRCVVDESKRNRVSVLGGRGTKDGLSRNNDESPDKVTVENKVGAVFGAQYQYKTDLKLFKLPVSVGVQGQTNKTGSVLLGLDF